MTKTEYQKYIGSPAWRNRRDEFLSILRNHECANCGLPRWLAVIAYDQDLHVHHLSYSNLGAELDEDLQSLCRRCHEVVTFGRSELHQPQTYPCDQCGKKHFNRFRETCSTCWSDLYADVLMFNAMEKHGWKFPQVPHSSGKRPEDLQVSAQGNTQISVLTG